MKTNGLRDGYMKKKHEKVVLSCDFQNRGISFSVSLLFLNWSRANNSKTPFITWLAFEKQKESCWKTEIQLFDFRAFQLNIQMQSHDKMIFYLLVGAFYITSREIFIQPTRHRGMGTWKWQQQNYPANDSRYWLCCWYRSLRCRKRFLQKVILHFIKTCAGKLLK